MTTTIPDWLLAHQQDPVGWMAECLGVSTLWSRQQEVARAIRDRKKVLVVSGNGVGKSYLAACLACWFLHTHPDSIVVTTATTWSQVRNVLWSEINRIHARNSSDAALHLRPLLGSVCTDFRMEISPRWFAVGLSTNDVSAFQGLHAPEVLVVLDEAQGVPKDIWDAAEAITVTEGSRILALANPLERQSPDYHAYTNGYWHVIRIPCEEHPNVIEGRDVIPGAVTRSWVDARRREWGEGSPIFQSRVMARYPQDSDLALLPLSALEAAASVNPTPRRSIDDVGHMGVDLARFGSDRSVIALRRGNDIEKFIVWQNADLMTSTGRVIAVATEYQVRPENIHIDVIGIGSGVVDRLREQSWNVDAVNSSSSPVGDYDRELGREARYANRRAELWWAARHLFTTGQLRLPAQYTELKGELAAPRYGYDSTGRLRVEGKDEIKKRVGRSPDLADAYVLSLSRRGTPRKPPSVPESSSISRWSGYTPNRPVSPVG